MSKTRRIKTLLDGGMSTRDVAQCIDCRIEYVRAVRNRMRNHASTGDARYPSEHGAYKRRYWRDPVFRELVRTMARSAYRSKRNEAAHA